MTIQEALVHFKSVRGIAEVLGISVQAVYAWDTTVPDLRAYQLREIMEKTAQKPERKRHSEREAA